MFTSEERDLQVIQKGAQVMGTSEKEKKKRKT